MIKASRSLGFSLIEVLLCIFMGCVLMSGWCLLELNLSRYGKEIAAQININQRMMNLSQQWMSISWAMQHRSCTGFNSKEDRLRSINQAQLPVTLRQQLKAESDVLLLSYCRKYKGKLQAHTIAYYLAKENNKPQLALFSKVLAINHQPHVLQRELIDEAVNKISYKSCFWQRAGQKEKGSKAYTTHLICSQAGLASSMLAHAYAIISFELAFDSKPTKKRSLTNQEEPKAINFESLIYL